MQVFSSSSRAGLEKNVSSQLNLTQLSSREREIVDLLSEGMQDKEIADRLELSPRTVSNYLQRLYKKLKINNRTELISRLHSSR